MKNTKEVLYHFNHYHRLFIFTAVLLIGLYSCSSQNQEDLLTPPQTNTGPTCANAPELTVNEVQESNCGQSVGSITVSGSGGSGTLTYSLDGQTFQATGTFNGLSNGTYTVVVKDDTGCTNSTEVTVGVNDSPSLAIDIVPIIQTNCAISGCHVSGAQSPNLSNRSGIISSAQRVLARTSQRTMPPSGSGKSLTDAQIESIRCWVESGAKDD